jgi:hypothetical protein
MPTCNASSSKDLPQNYRKLVINLANALMAEEGKS